VVYKHYLLPSCRDNKTISFINPLLSPPFLFVRETKTMISTYENKSEVAKYALPDQFEVTYARNGGHKFKFTDDKGINHVVCYSTKQSLSRACELFCKEHVSKNGTLVLNIDGASIADKLHAVPMDGIPGPAVMPASGKRLELGDYVVELKAERAA
jgi:hypothetical protein